MLARRTRLACVALRCHFSAVFGRSVCGIVGMRIRGVRSRWVCRVPRYAQSLVAVDFTWLWVVNAAVMHRNRTVGLCDA